MLLWTAVVLGWTTLALGGSLLFLALICPHQAGDVGRTGAGEGILRLVAVAWALVLLWIILDILGTWVGR